MIKRASLPSRTPDIKWLNLSFFIVTTAVALIGTPLYWKHHGIQLSEILILLFFCAATGLSITVGYHRLFAHVTYKANSVLQFLLLFFGAAAFEQSALKWASQHRTHHQYTDTDRDPYNIKEGFWYAHIGWLIFWKHRADYRNVRDLRRLPVVMHQHFYYPLWAVVSGILVPIAIGFLMGRPLGGFILSVCLRLTLVYHSTFFINSICHMIGKTTYDPDSSAKDHWLVALLTYGEGYHNFHHRFPSDYRNGVRWYHFDPSKWLIAFLSKIGWTWELRKISKFRILSAQHSAEHSRLIRKLEKLTQEETESAAADKLKNVYHNLRKALERWEQAASHMFEKNSLRKTYLEYKKSRHEWLRFAQKIRVSRI